MSTEKKCLKKRGNVVMKERKFNRREQKRYDSWTERERDTYYRG